MYRILISLIALVSMTGAPAVHAQRYQFAVVPEWRISEQRDTWQLVIGFLSTQLPFDIEFVETKTLKQFETDLKEGRFDIVYLNPYHYTLFDEQPGYRALVAPRSRPSVGVLLARMNDPVETIGDLESFTLALPPPKNFSASIVTQLPLIKEGTDYKRSYYATSELAWKAVLSGDADIAADSLVSFDKAPAEIHVGLRKIWQSVPYSPYAVASHPRVKIGDLLALKKAFVKLSKDPDIQVILEELDIPFGFQGARHSQWDDARAIDYKSLNRKQQSKAE